LLASSADNPATALNEAEDRLMFSFNEKRKNKETEKKNKKNTKKKRNKKSLKRNL